MIVSHRITGHSGMEWPKDATFISIFPWEFGLLVRLAKKYAEIDNYAEICNPSEHVGQKELI
jgi:hypothetical protein